MISKTLKWSAVGQIGSFVLKMVINIILARTLGPQVYGVFALIFVWTSMADVFIDSGFKSALIQREQVTIQDYNTVFTFNLAIAIVIYLLSFCLAPYYAGYYANPDLINLIRVFSLLFFIKAFSLVAISKLNRDLNFKPIAFAEMLSYITLGIVAFILGYLKFGIWALVFGYIASELCRTLAYVISVKGNFRFEFSKASFKKLGSFGIYNLGSAMISEFANRLDALILGKHIDAVSLGLYSKGKDYASLPATLFSRTINQVLFPKLSAKQNDPKSFLNLYFKVISLSSLAGLLVYMGVIFFSNFIIRVFLGSEWLPMTIYFKWFCVYGFLFILNSSGLYALYALGLSRLNFVISIVLSVIKIVLFVFLLYYNKFNAMYVVYIIILILLIEFWLHQHNLYKNLKNFISKVEYIKIMLQIAFQLALLICSVVIGLNIYLYLLLTICFLYLIFKQYLSFKSTN